MEAKDSTCLPVVSPLIRKVCFRGREVEICLETHKIKFGCKGLEVNLKDFVFYPVSPREAVRFQIRTMAYSKVDPPVPVGALIWEYPMDTMICRCSSPFRKWCGTVIPHQPLPIHGFWVHGLNQPADVEGLLL